MSLLTMEGIRKSFGPVSVLKDVRLTIEKGEVHALMGENGAGKSTLMNVLTGVHQRDAGTIVFDGEEFHNVTIKYTEEKGIAFVHQELNLFNDLKVFENIFLGKEYVNKFGKLDKKRMIAESRKLFEELGVDIDPDAVVSDLRTSQKQLLEISKALFFKAKLLILDEPTTSLNNDEVDHLFGIIRNLKAGYPALVTWQEETKADAARRMYSETRLGRRRYLPNIRSDDWGKKSFAERCSMNTPIQGTAADIIKLSLGRLLEGLPERPWLKPILQIHDELTFIIPEGKLTEAVSYIKSCMEPQPFPEFDLPLVAEASAGRTFGSMEELED